MLPRTLTLPPFTISPLAASFNRTAMDTSTGDTMFAIGAAGGRKILPSVTNLASFMLDFGMSLEAAFHHPRIDVSGTERIIADEDLSPEIVEALSGVADTGTAKRTVHPYAFGVPAGVMRQNGRNCGATEIMSPWGDAILADDIA